MFSVSLVCCLFKKRWLVENLSLCPLPPVLVRLCSLQMTKWKIQMVTTMYEDSQGSSLLRKRSTGLVFQFEFKSIQTWGLSHSHDPTSFTWTWIRKWGAWRLTQPMINGAKDQCSGRHTQEKPPDSTRTIFATLCQRVEYNIFSLSRFFFCTFIILYCDFVMLKEYDSPVYIQHTTSPRIYPAFKLNKAIKITYWCCSSDISTFNHMHVIEHTDLDERSRSLEVAFKSRLWV